VLHRRSLHGVTSYNLVVSLANLLLTLLITAPSFLWFLSNPTFSQFNSLSNILLTLGQLSALTGATLFCLNFILAARYKIVEDLLKGLNRAFLLHHKIGKYAFYLLLLHPLFINAQYLLISPQSVLDFFVNSWLDLPTLFGNLAIWTLIILLSLTLYVKLRYELWKFTHQFLGITLLFAFLHITLIPSTISYYLPLRYYMLTLFALASYSYTYRVLLGPLLIRRFPYLITNVETKGEVTEVTMIPETLRMDYLPGQFAFFEIKQVGVQKEFHPFSITSPLGSKTLSFAAKSLGDFTQNLKNLKPRSSVRIEGPYGRFIFSQAQGNQLWIAGGIGITPFLSQIRTITSDHKYNIVMYYSVTTQNEAVYMDEILKISKSVPNFKVILYESQTQGRISAEQISKSVKDFKSRDIFLCGPTPMMKSLRTQFRSLGVDNDKIHSEEFSLK